MKLTNCTNNIFSFFSEAKAFNNAVRAFVDEINPSIKVRITRDEFYAICDKNLINVSTQENTYGDWVFCNFIKKRFGIDINPFLIGILHEIGHIMTYDEQLDSERSILYYLLQIDYKSDQIEEFSDMYFQIPAEFEATKWAVNYYLSNKDFCDNFLKEIGYAA